MGEVHGKKTRSSAASSSAHSNVAPCWSASNLKVALVLCDGSSGPDRMTAFGTGPIVQRYSAGLSSTAPALLFARTSSTCWPTGRLTSSYGDAQEPNAAPSRAHSKSASGSFEENSKAAVLLTVETG